MAKRRFELPGIHELSKQQEQAIRLPLDGCHLVIGGPGTGKTVVTLLRLKRYLQQSPLHPPIFLVYNRLLLASARQLFGDRMASFTWMRWFVNTYAQATGQHIPTCSVDADFKPIDWPTVIDRLSASGTSYASGLAHDPADTHLFIDEGQDMPIDFYTALIHLGFKHFYVVADQNQAITAQHCSRLQLQQVLDIAAAQVIELTHNFRNPLPVARLAAEFYPDDPATPRLDMPVRPASVQTPCRVEYGPDVRLDFSGLIERILKLADRNPGHLIGILTPNNRIRKKYLGALDQTAQTGSIRLDHGSPRIVSYASNATELLRFDEGGIVVINAHSCKGLEFDMVFIADLNAFVCHPAIEDEIRRLFYVMVARAKERVYLLKESLAPCPLACILPNNPDILAQWR